MIAPACQVSCKFFFILHFRAREHDPSSSSEPVFVLGKSLVFIGLLCLQAHPVRPGALSLVLRPSSLEEVVEHQRADDAV